MPRVSLLHAHHPPGNLAAKVSVASGDGPEGFARVLTGDPASAAAAFDGLVASGQLLDSVRPSAWTYRIVRDGETSLGLVVAVDRPGGSPPHALVASRGVEPAIATVRAGLSPALLELMRASTTERPLFHFKAPDGLTHTGWTIADRSAVEAELAGLTDVEIDQPTPGHFTGRLILPGTPAFPPRIGLFARRLVGVAGGP